MNDASLSLSKGPSLLLFDKSSVLKKESSAFEKNTHGGLVHTSHLLPYFSGTLSTDPFLAK
jgi:hypothetical protein